MFTKLGLSSSFITPEGSKISHKNRKIHKITHTKYDTKLHISTHTHTHTDDLLANHIKHKVEKYEKEC